MQVNYFSGIIDMYTKNDANPLIYNGLASL